MLPLRQMHIVHDSHILSLCNKAQKNPHGPLNGLMHVKKACVDFFKECGAISSSVHCKKRPENGLVRTDIKRLLTLSTDYK